MGERIRLLIPVAAGPRGMVHCTLRPRPRSDPVPTAMRLEDLLDEPHTPDERARERAVRRLVRRGRVGFTPEQGVLVLKASSLPYPPRRDRADDTAVDLLRAALQVPFPEYLPHVVERYQHWSPRARAEALRLLMR